MSGSNLTLQLLCPQDHLIQAIATDTAVEHAPLQDTLEVRRPQFIVLHREAFGIAVADGENGSAGGEFQTSVCGCAPSAE